MSATEAAMTPPKRYGYRTLILSVIQAANSAGIIKAKRYDYFYVAIRSTTGQIRQGESVIAICVVPVAFPAPLVVSSHLAMFLPMVEAFIFETTTRPSLPTSRNRDAVSHVALSFSCLADWNTSQIILRLRSRPTWYTPCSALASRLFDTSYHCPMPWTNGLDGFREPIQVTSISISPRSQWCKYSGHLAQQITLPSTT